MGAGPPLPPPRRSSFMPSLLANAFAVPALGAYAVAAGGSLVLAGQRGWLQPAQWEARPVRILPEGVSAGMAVALFMVVAGAAVGVDAGHLHWPRGLAAFLTNVGLLLGAVAFMKRFGQHLEDRHRSGISSRHLRRDLVVGLGGFLVGVALTKGVIAGVLVLAGGAGLEVVPVAGAAGPTPAEVALLVATAVVTAPILEELVYRGLMQTVLRQVFGGHARVVVILLPAAVFALVHLPGSSWAGVAGLFVLGTVLGAIYERTGSLLPCVIAHASYNALNLMLVWLT